MKKINCILIIVAVLGIVFAFSLFSKEGIAINVNSKNKDLVSKSFDSISNRYCYYYVTSIFEHKVSFWNIK